MLHLSTVSDTFELSGRSSLVVVPGVPTQGLRSGSVKVGEPVVLEAPDGTLRDTVIGGLERVPPHLGFIPIMLGPGITKPMVPIGTKIWVEIVDRRPNRSRNR